MHSYEVEIKSLLGSKENADKIRKSFGKKGISAKGSHRQLNHYFNAPKDLTALSKSIIHLIPEGDKKSFKKITEEGSKISVRTRDADGKILLVMKASIGSDTSSNGVSRIEFESVVSKTLEELDKILLDAGLTYQAKWSREREEYEDKKRVMQITIDRNAGYGYVAEFEKKAGSPEEAKIAEEEIRDFMKEMGIEELSQERLERMFDFYNKNWEDYYGTEKTFTVE